MKAPVRLTASKTHLQQKKRKDAYSAFIYRALNEDRDATAANRALQADHPGCPKRVLLRLVALEAFRTSRTHTRRRITPHLLTAALIQVLRGTRARSAA